MWAQLTGGVPAACQVDSQHDEVALGEGDEVSAEEGEVVLGAGEDDKIQYLQGADSVTGWMMRYCVRCTHVYGWI